MMRPQRVCIWANCRMNVVFLDAFSNLYKRVCPSVRPSVRPYVRPYVRNAFSKIVIYLSGTMGQKCLKSTHLALVSTMTLSPLRSAPFRGASRRCTPLRGRRSTPLRSAHGARERVRKCHCTNEG